jgi:exopolyphosphatase / guanosine-5'-triphosphate,3'-diphosphate pyrophosphatase
MAKVTTIIDIGSNSMRMVVCKKSSRFGFSIINETKSRVKISQGSYTSNSYLQESAMKRAYDCLESFLDISKSLKSRKIFVIATSALRDAPNSKEFLSKVSKNLRLNIKIIDGIKEAYFGGIAALNLLFIKDFMTIDIGGGSTEFCFVKNRKIEKSISLDLGTIRLHELYFNKNDIKGAKNLILDQLDNILEYTNDIPKTIVGIGGTIRALSKIVLKKIDHPLDILHAFEYNIKDIRPILLDVLDIKDSKDFKKIGIKKDRYDTILEGSLIFNTILEKFEIDNIITSRAGVREGVYLNDILRTSNYRFPNNFNVSVRNVLDKFQIDDKQNGYLGKNIAKIFDILNKDFKIDQEYKRLLIIASKLHCICITLDMSNIFDFILHSLKYDFSHSSRVLVAYLIKYSKKSLSNSVDIEKYKRLLPDIKVLEYLTFIMNLNLILASDFRKTSYTYVYEDDILKIYNENISYLVKTNIDKIDLPNSIKLKLID